MPFIITPEKMKYLGVHLTKQVQGIYLKSVKCDERNKERPKYMASYTVFMDWNT